MSARKSGHTQLVSAAKAGISERRGRDIEHGERPNPRQQRRSRRTRPDPLASVWQSECVPLLESEPTLQAITLLEYLQERHEGEIADSLLRTLQRRVKEWKALHGPEKEVMFRQQHEPGRLGLSDFTELKEVTILVQNKPLVHRLYHFRLAFSHWSHLKVILGGESYTALAEGLQEALWRLGGSPLEHRTDSLSAGFKNLSASACQDITARYEAFCSHYAMVASRNNPGAKHENGSVESPHGHLKRRIRQALLIRGSNHFKSVLDYQQWLDGVVQQHNRRNAKAVIVERDALQPLPVHKTADYTEVVAKVTSSSTIDVRRATYTTPSRLQGETLRVHLYHDRLCCYLGSTLAVTLDRVYPTGKTNRARNINYRHVIHSLMKKPQAFRYSQIREDLLPTDAYRAIWQHVNRHMPAKQACKFIVGLLYLAATENCEQPLADTVLHKIAKGQSLQLTALQKQFKPQVEPPLEKIVILHPPLASYDQCMNSHQEKHYVAS